MCNNRLMGECENLDTDLGSETKLQRWAAELLRDRGFVAIRVNSGQLKRKGYYAYRMYTPNEPSTRTYGVSDIIAFKNGNSLFLEMKRIGGEMSDVQVEFRNIITEQGFMHFAPETKGQVLDAINEFEVRYSE